MKDTLEWIIAWFVGIVSIVFMVLLGIGLSWIATCLTVKAITWCFGIAFSWKVSTGIWLIVCLIRLAFPKKETK